MEDGIKDGAAKDTRADKEDGMDKADGIQEAKVDGDKNGIQEARWMGTISRVRPEGIRKGDERKTNGDNGAERQQGQRKRAVQH